MSKIQLDIISAAPAALFLFMSGKEAKAPACPDPDKVMISRFQNYLTLRGTGQASTGITHSDNCCSPRTAWDFGKSWV